MGNVLDVLSQFYIYPTDALNISQVTLKKKCQFNLIIPLFGLSNSLNSQFLEPQPVLTVSYGGSRPHDDTHSKWQGAQTRTSFGT